MQWNEEAEAERLKREGMQRAADAKATLLAHARMIAARIVNQYGVVNADDVAANMRAMGMDYAALGNAAGSVFDGFNWTGLVVKSKRASTHGRMIKVWSR